MDDKSPLPLDGNAAGGLLCELFAFDMTAASITCDGCGSVSQVGELALYGGAPPRTASRGSADRHHPACRSSCNCS